MAPRDTTARSGSATVIALVALALLAAPLTARAGAQVEEQLAPSVALVLARTVADVPVPANYSAKPDVRSWLDQMSPRLASRFPDLREREDLLATVHYEAIRAALDPQLVLAVIQYESAFRKYAVSSADARGYMQVMPFWTKWVPGAVVNDLFRLRVNLRYGCWILKHYLDRENGDISRALGRYNGSLGQPEYPNGVLATKDRHWTYSPSSPGTKLGAVTASSLTR